MFLGVKEFRLIACCTLIYKVISKIITSRLGCVIPKIVSNNQSEFIVGREIANNILMASELVRGYGREYM